MDENKEIKSLLSESAEIENDSANQDEVLYPESLLDENDTNDESVVDYLDERHEKVRNIVEDRKRFFTNPVNQAEILFQNYTMSHPDMILSGKQKRNLRREFLKNAKKGKYAKMFEKIIYDIPTDETKETFQNLNS